MATTAKDFVESKKIPHNEQIIYGTSRGGGMGYDRKSYKLSELLEEYHQLKMREAGFIKDDKNREDTIKI